MTYESYDMTYEIIIILWQHNNIITIISFIQSKVEAEVHKDEESAEKAKKQVVKRGVTGKVKWFNVARGYGFIERDDNEQDVFRMLFPQYSNILK